MAYETWSGKMGYETYAVVAVNKVDYPNGVDWKEWQDLVTYQDEDEYKIRYKFGWDKQVYKAVDYFISKVAKREPPEVGFSSGYLREETFGVISLGEDLDDIDHWGDYWDYDISIHRSVEFY